MQTKVGVSFHLRQSWYHHLAKVFTHADDSDTIRSDVFHQIQIGRLLVLRILTRWTIITICLVSLIVYICFSSTFVFAQIPGIEPGETNDQPKTRTTIVSASVPDIVPPSAPVLISPLNNSLLTNSRVSFVFDGSTDNVGVDHYQLWKDGVLTYANLNPLGEIATEYTLTVTTNRYTLLPTLAQTDGSHTWKVVAVDAAANNTNSATWQFTVDSQAPTFIVNRIDGQVFSISAQDLLTIPTTPISVSSAEPSLSGLGEANSTGVVAVNIAGQSAQLVTFTISSTGAWQIQLPSLPFDSLANLDFTITDQAGNVSVLSDLLLIRPSTLVVTATPNLILTTGTPIPTPTQSFTTGQITPLPSSAPPFLIPGPVQPIVKQITRLSQTPRALLAQVMPNTFVADWRPPLFSLTNLILPLLLVFNWIWLILPLIVCIIWLSRFLPKALTISGLKQIWWAIGFGNQPSPQGVVFGLPNFRLLPFATLVTISTLPSGQTQLSYRISNRWGEYLAAPLVRGTHNILVDFKGFLFPAVFNVPAHQDFSSYYLGEDWLIDEQHKEPHLLIPLLESNQTPSRRPPDWLLDLTHQRGKGVLGHTFVILMTFILIPSIFNGLAFITLVVLIMINGLRYSRRYRSLAKVYGRDRESVNRGAGDIRGNSDSRLVFGIYRGMMTQPLSDEILSSNSPECQSVVNKQTKIVLTEASCSVLKDQVVI